MSKWLIIGGPLAGLAVGAVSLASCEMLRGASTGAVVPPDVVGAIAGAAVPAVATAITDSLREKPHCETYLAREVAVAACGEVNRVRRTLRRVGEPHHGD